MPNENPLNSEKKENQVNFFFYEFYPIKSTIVRQSDDTVAFSSHLVNFIILLHRDYSQCFCCFSAF